MVPLLALFDDLVKYTNLEAFGAEGIPQHSSPQVDSRRRGKQNTRERDGHCSETSPGVSLAMHSHRDVLDQSHHEYREGCAGRIVGIEAQIS